MRETERDNGTDGITACHWSTGCRHAIMPYGLLSRTLRALLQDGKPHVFDGAMGTMLYAKGVFVNVCYDELSLKQPNLVREVHRDYVKAGAEILETNTFGANPVKLSAYGLAEQTEEINRAAAARARGARGG